jgi:hypothetical protein
MQTQTVNVPTVLEQKLFGTPISYETKLSRAELRTLLYVGRKLELIACYMPMSAPQSRTVKAHKSYGYVMAREDGRDSRLDFEKGQTIVGLSAGNGFYEFKVLDADGKTVAAHYKLL